MSEFLETKQTLQNWFFQQRELKNNNKILKLKANEIYEKCEWINNNKNKMCHSFYNQYRKKNSLEAEVSIFSKNL